MKTIICYFIGKAKELKIDNFVVKGKSSKKGGIEDTFTFRVKREV